MERVRHLVVGAGISGLAYADRLGKGEDYLVLEADAEIGGYCKTVAQDGFTWDYSGHFFHFKHSEIEHDLVTRMHGQRILRVQKDSRIFWKDGTWIDFPFQKNIHQLPREEFLECLHDLHFRDRSAKPASFRDMLYAKFGRGIAEKFLVPYNEKLYATDLAVLDVDAMGRFFPYADEDEILRNFTQPDNASYNSTFTYPEGGAIQYVHAIASGVDPARIALSERVQSIDLRRKVARTSKGREIAFEYLVSSAPFVKLLEMSALPHEPSTYTWNKVLVFNLGFDRKGPESVHWMYFPQRELSFYRIGFYDNIFGTDRMSLYVEIGHPKDTTIDAAAIESARAHVIEDLVEAGIVTDHRLVSSHSVVMDPAYVHITRASLKDVAAKKRILESRGVYSIGRYGSWTYCSIEDNIVEARALADALVVPWR
ncbi:protoporphyrinogen/coproporphyrinogen oxidase [Sandaracinus amylolyticus]|uniref:protoporphyrinogen/coproporphyrinogen oxidase n=1 Tax=Sandaracinus amylolyticus TaxID=927083 RepID=UPI001F1B4501|nr:FAD-dependent oxidoreductase [Sandaracinus amylolyticus]UJR81993.1 FAD-dependent oxidoreductase [Sandaracinus amylolyticus]